EEKLFHPEVVARAEESPPRAVPDREGEIADEVPHAILAPGVPGMENERRIAAGVHAFAPIRGKAAPKLALCVHACVRDDPALTVERHRLRACRRARIRPQLGVR